MKHRVDIDGLRAIAVIAVLIFHLDPQWLPGGFVGVDVFFVVSGYLITNIIRKNIAEGSFSFLSFYIKRLRRIFPALLFTTLCVVIAGYLLFKPTELVSLYRSALTQPFALQNMHFLIEGEYFNGSERKPLLHTWSLAVEEQFYLIWPLVLLYVSRLSRRWALVTVTVFVVGSYAVNLVLLPLSPKASFFLFPARAWELAAGGLLAIALENQNLKRVSRLWKEVISAAGAALLIVGFFAISSDISHPGWLALFPVLGTLCLIWTAQGTYISAVLSLKPLVWTGLISYSLYLWHWPVIVYARVLGYELHNPSVLFSVVSSCFVFATLSYLLVEQPFRKKQILRSNRNITAAFSAASVLLVLVSFAAIKTEGFSFKYQEPARSMLTASFNADGDGRCGFIFRVFNPEKFICHTNNVNTDAGNGVLLWGDSHAAMWLGLVDELGQEHARPVFLSARNCRPTPDFAFCGQATQNAVLSAIEDERISDVILASSWYGASSTTYPPFEPELKAVVKRLEAMNVKVWLVIDPPSGEKFNPVKQYAKSPAAPRVGAYPYSVFEDQFLREHQLFENIRAMSSQVNVLDPTKGLCPAQTHCLGGQGDDIWYRDEDHLTSRGAQTAQEVFRTAFTDL